MILLESLMASAIAYMAAMVTVPVMWTGLGLLTGEPKLQEAWVFFTGPTQPFIFMLGSPALVLFTPVYFALRAMKWLSLSLLAIAGGFVGLALGLLPAAFVSRGSGSFFLALSGGNVLAGALGAYLAGLYMRSVDPKFAGAQ